MVKSKKAVKKRAKGDALTLTDDQLRAQINAENADAFAALEGQLRSPLGVIPFIGAGLSAGIRLDRERPTFPPWDELLRKLAKGTSIETKVEALLKAGNYERAATIIDKNRPGSLARSIRGAFDRDIPEAEVLRGPISYLPYLASGPVITTNYDHVLEDAFRLAHRGFADSIIGPKEDRIVSAIHMNERALFKIHGDCRDRSFRVLTSEEYDAAYGTGTASGKRVAIGRLSWLLFTNRPLLFLGCSLENDRTVLVLRAIKQQLPGLTHFAVMAADHSRRRWSERKRHLDGLGIQSLWFFPGEYGEIEKILDRALERASTRPMRLPRIVPQAGTAKPAKLPAILDGLLKEHPDSDGAPHKTDISLITRSLYEGGQAFFLGAYAGLNPKLLGFHFYQSLAEKFESPDLVGDRTAVATFISSRFGYEKLLKEVRSIFQEKATEPSVVHRFIAALPAFLRERQVTAPLWILTTNYDTLMEQAMTDAGEKFQLLYYVNDVGPYSGGRPHDADDLGPGGGGFIERSPDGEARLIEKPANLRNRGSTAHVIVKLNGGLDFFRNIPEQVSIDRADFERLAAHIPAVLPAFLRSELRSRSLLFLGHGLAEPDVHQLIKFAGRDRELWAWAVKLAPSFDLRKGWDEDARYWRGRGLQVLDDNLERFMAALGRRILQGPS
jgi:SIR2-like domain